MTALPIHVQAFLAAADTPSFDGTALHRPSWLLDHPESDVWRIPCVHEADRELSSGSDVVVLRWNARLPDGNLCDSAYGKVLLHAKLLMLAIGSDGRRSTPMSLATIFRTLLRLIEFAVVTHAGRAIEDGLLSIDIEDVVELVALEAEGGSAAVGRFEERWNQWLSARIDPRTEQRLEEWARAQPQGIQAELGWVPMEGMADVDRKSAVQRTWLFRDHAYGEDGMVTKAYIAQAINVSARRLRDSPHALSRLSLRRATVPGGQRARAEKPRDTINLSNQLILIAEVACRVSQLEGWVVCEPGVLRERLAHLAQSSGGRTKTIPLSIGLAMVRSCIAWANDVAPALESAIAKAGAAITAEAGEAESMAQRFDAWFEERPIHLGSISAGRFWGRTGDTNASLEAALTTSRSPGDVQQTTVAQLIALHTAITFVLAATFSCSRRSEILDLEDDDLSSRGDLSLLRIRLRKTGAYSVRRSMNKPIPPIVAHALRIQLNIRDVITSVLGPAGGVRRQKAFFLPKRSGVTAMNVTTFDLRLALLSRCLQSDKTGAESWVLSAHQLRRFFAITFFHHGGKENALPALTWFMGHTGMAQTWRYIQDSLGGREITEVEAALATAAVLGDNQSSSVERLRRLLREHFGQEDLWTIDEEKVEDYLCLLRSQGAYTATPKQIRTADGVRHTVLIHFELRAAK